MDYVIETINLRKCFGNLCAVKNVNLKIKKGEIFGFLGPNGAGKTTTINMLITLIKPTSGEAYVNGYNVNTEGNQIRETVGFVPQEVVLENQLTARENMEFYGRLYNVPEEGIQDKIPELLRMVDLQDRENDLVATYSGGMKRRLEIAKAFLHSPPLIILDEPTIGLDPQTRRAIWDKIREFNDKLNVSIFLTTHYLEEADILCDRVAIIDHGEIKAMDTPEKLKQSIGQGDVIDIHVPNDLVEKFSDALKSIDNSPKILENRSIRVVINNGGGEIPKIVNIAEKLKVPIDSISMHEPSLEDAFIHYTGRGIRDEGAEGRGKIFRKLMSR